LRLFYLAKKRISICKYSSFAQKNQTKTDVQIMTKKTVAIIITIFILFGLIGLILYWFLPTLITLAMNSFVLIIGLIVFVVIIVIFYKLILSVVTKFIQ